MLLAGRASLPNVWMFRWPTHFCSWVFVYQPPTHTWCHSTSCLAEWVPARHSQLHGPLCLLWTHMAHASGNHFRLCDCLNDEICQCEIVWLRSMCKCHVLQLQIVFTSIHIKRPEDLTRPGLWPANLYVYVYALILVIPIISMNMLWHSCLHEKKT